LTDAIKNEDKAGIQELFKGLLGEELEAKQDEALRLAIENNNLELCAWLIDEGAPLDVLDYNGKTVLHPAIKHPEITKLFVKKVININAPDKYGETPLMLATEYPESLKILIDAGADLELEQGVGFGKSGYTALMVASDYPESLKMLIEAGANVNARSGAGYTPLMLAVQVQNVESVQLLIDAGAKLNKKTKKRREDAMHFAEYHLNSETTPEAISDAERIVSILMKAGSKSSYEVQENRSLFTSILALSLITVLWIISLFYIRRAFIAKKWPTVQGFVRDSGVGRAYSVDESRLYDVRVEYQYKVDGEEFTSTRIRFLRHIRTTNRKALQKIADKYYPNREVAVFYKPDKPEMSVLEPGKATSWMIFLFVYLAASGVIAGILLLSLIK